MEVACGVWIGRFPSILTTVASFYSMRRAAHVMLTFHAKLSLSKVRRMIALWMFSLIQRERLGDLCIAMIRLTAQAGVTILQSLPSRKRSAHGG